MFLFWHTYYCIRLKENTGSLISLTGFRLYSWLSSLYMRRGTFVLGLAYLWVFFHLYPIVKVLTLDVRGAFFNSSIGFITMGLVCVSVGEIIVMVWYFVRWITMYLFYVVSYQWRGVEIWYCVSWFFGGGGGGRLVSVWYFWLCLFHTLPVELFRFSVPKLVWARAL